MPVTIELQAALVLELPGGQRISIPTGTDLTFLDAAGFDAAAEQLAGVSREALRDNMGEFNREEVVDGRSSQITYGVGGEKQPTDQGIPPALESAVIEDAADTVIVATFDQELTSPGEDFALGFSCEVEGVARVISGAVQQVDLAVIHFTLASAVTEGEAVTLSYNNATGDVVSPTGGELQSFVDTEVTNNVAP